MNSAAKKSDKYLWKERILPWLLVLIVNVVFYGLFYDRGWIPVDDGYLNAPVLSMMQAGKIPHFDFEIAHPGLLYYFHQWLFLLFGPTILATRYAWYAMGVLLSLIWFWIGRKMLSLNWSYGLVLAVMATGPVVFVNSNNTWYSLFLMTLQLALMMRWIQQNEPVVISPKSLFLPGICGFVSGVIFLLKQSLGVFSFLAVVLSILSWLLIYPQDTESKTSIKTVSPWLVRVITIVPIVLVMIFITVFTLSDKPHLNWQFTVLFLPYFLVLLIFFEKLTKRPIPKARFRCAVSALLSFTGSCSILPLMAAGVLIFLRGWQPFLEALHQCYFVTPKLFIAAFTGKNIYHVIFGPVVFVMVVLSGLLFWLISQNRRNFLAFLVLLLFVVATQSLSPLHPHIKNDHTANEQDGLFYLLAVITLMFYFRWLTATVIVAKLMKCLTEGTLQYTHDNLFTVLLAHYAAITFMISFPCPNIVAYGMYGYSFVLACLMVFAYQHCFKAFELNSFLVAFQPRAFPVTIRYFLPLCLICLGSMVFFTARGQYTPQMMVQNNPLLVFSQKLFINGKSDIYVSAGDYRRYNHIQRIVRHYSQNTRDVVSFPDNPEIYFLTQHLNPLSRYMVFGQAEYPAAWQELKRVLNSDSSINIVFVPALTDAAEGTRGEFCSHLLGGLTTPPHFMTITRQIVSDAGFKLRFLNPCFDVYLREEIPESKQMPFDSLPGLGREQGLQ